MQLERLKELLAHYPRVYLIASNNKNKINEYKRLMEGAPVLSIYDLAQLLEIDICLLDSKETELSYEEIAKGKVIKIQNALRKGGFTSEDLKNLNILADDYGASFACISLNYAPELEADEPFKIIYDAHDHINTILTNREELDGYDAPGYFSHRVIESVRLHYNLIDKNAAFEKLASEIVYMSHRKEQFGSFATVALAWSIDLAGVGCDCEKEFYPMILDINDMAKVGFDFDRMQRIRKAGPTIAELSIQEKDKDFIRGKIVKRVLKILK